MAPVIRLLQEAEGIDSKVCVTAQHREMLDQVLSLFQIQTDLDLDLMRESQDLFDVTARVISGMKRVLEEIAPDLVLVHGDTTTTFAAALASYYAGIPIGHVEAGLRTGDKFAPFPEEINRQLADRLADLHFAPTKKARENLVQESLRPEGIVVTGNTSIDALLWIQQEIRSGNLKPNPSLLDIEPDRRIVLITAHRRESFGKGFENICLAIRDLGERYPETLFVYPVHLNPNVQEPVQRHLSGLSNIRLLEPLPYAEIVALLERSHLVITDSGGIQEEAPALGKPVLVLREVTERPEAVEAGTVLLVGANRDKIVGEASRLLDDPGTHSEFSRKINPYGDGQAAERIVGEICKYFGLSDPYGLEPFSG